MKKLITTIVFILTVTILYGQIKDNKIFVGSIISDTSMFKSNEYQTDLTSILKSNYKIEIRFIRTPSTNTPSYTVLTYDNKWNAKYYYYKPESNIYTLLTKDIIAKTTVDSIFKQLVLNNIFSLPDQKSLITKMYEYNPESDEFIDSNLFVRDGICYTIEFKVGSNFRRYTYCNPEIYADFYTQVYELRSFSNIVKIFTELNQE